MFRRVLTASARQASQSSRRYVSSYRHQRSTANLAYYAAGATVLTAGYLGLSLTQEHGRVYNDSEAPSPSSTATPKKRTPKVKEEPPVSEFVADTPTPVSNNTLPAADSSSEPKSPSDDGKDITIASVESKGDSDESEDEGGAGAVAGGGGGAYNPETGEINWDCPCLGGMAHGPCGPEFREAFSCFIFSEVEPKGMDCVEKFKGMQTCFREHPEIYGDEIMRDDDDEDDAPLVGGQGETAIPVASEDPAEPTPSASAEAPSSAPKPKAKKQQRPTQGEATTQVTLEETSTLTPTSLDTPAPAPKP